MIAEGALLDALERRTDYQFKDRGLLKTALTHASAVGDARIASGDTYQRLEFLGDRVLGLVVASMLLEAFPLATEGELSSRLADLVRKETCADVAVTLDIGGAVVFGGNRAQQRALLTVNVLGDVCEALIGAIYLDGGYAQARAFVEQQWRERMFEAPTGGRNAKSTLQEWAQAKGHGTPIYEIVDRRGPDHAPTFIIEVRINGLGSGRGEGRNRREAEQVAATSVLMREGVWSTSQ